MILSYLAVAVVAMPVLALGGLVLLALLPAREMRGWTRPTAAVLVPAHNEEEGIAATLTAIKDQSHPEDKLIVIADNCTDKTAEVARAMGVTVLERQNEKELGKGYALAYGLEYLRKDPPLVIVMMDADCLPAEGAMDALVRGASEGGTVQAAYLMGSPEKAGLKGYLSAFAFCMKNQVRPRGLDRILCPVLLTGTGMAFSWERIQDVNLASGNIVEDMQLGIDLAIREHGARVCPKAVVMGQLPAGKKNAFRQRKRWEHGHLRTIITQVPRMVYAGMWQPALWGLAIDLLIPPLALLAMGWLAVMGGLIAGWRYNNEDGLLPLQIHAITGFVFLLVTGIAWLRFARNSVPLWALFAVPFYIVWKVPLYIGFLFKPEKKWVRTDRETGKV